MTQEIAQRMPVTAEIAARIGPGGLDGLTIIHVNHLLMDILDLNVMLAELGATVIYVPVIYSENKPMPPAPYAVFRPGAYNGNGTAPPKGFASSRFSASINYAVRAAMQSALAQPANGARRILLIEDGGYHYDIQKELDGMADETVFVGTVEQTVAGIRAARAYLRQNGSIDHPVVSVARSKAKMRFENQFVAMRVIEELALLFYQLEEFLSLKDVLLLGYGILGRAAAFLLRARSCHVTVKDMDEVVIHAAETEGFEVFESFQPEMFDSAPVVLGMTGTPAFTMTDFVAFLDGTSPVLYLASGSSKRVEFAHLINYFEGDDDDRAAVNAQVPQLQALADIEVHTTPVGLDYTFTYQGRPRKVVLFAKGQPVNFFRADSDSLPAKVADVINAEVLALVHYLYGHQNQVEPRLHLLGHDSLAGFDVEEDELLTLWFAKNQVSSTLMQKTNLWRLFPPHPCEHRLVNSC